MPLDTPLWAEYEREVECSPPAISFLFEFHVLTIFTTMKPFEAIERRISIILCLCLIELYLACVCQMPMPDLVLEKAMFLNPRCEI